MAEANGDTEDGRKEPSDSFASASFSAITTESADPVDTTVVVANNMDDATATSGSATDNGGPDTSSSSSSSPKWLNFEGRIDLVWMTAASSSTTTSEKDGTSSSQSVPSPAPPTVSRPVGGTYDLTWDSFPPTILGLTNSHSKNVVDADSLDRQIPVGSDGMTMERTVKTTMTTTGETEEGANNEGGSAKGDSEPVDRQEEVVSDQQDGAGGATGEREAKEEQEAELETEQPPLPAQETGSTSTFAKGMAVAEISDPMERLPQQDDGVDDAARPTPILLMEDDDEQKREREQRRVTSEATARREAEEKARISHSQEESRLLSEAAARRRAEEDAQVKADLEPFRQESERSFRWLAEESARLEAEADLRRERAQQAREETKAKSSPALSSQLGTADPIVLGDVAGNDLGTGNGTETVADATDPPSGTSMESTVPSAASTATTGTTIPAAASVSAVVATGSDNGIPSVASSPATSSTITTAPRLIVLTSRTTATLQQRTQQDQALTILKATGLDSFVEEVDGSDPSNKDRRNKLFGVSGLRGQYPQFFLQGPTTTTTTKEEVDVTFLGDFDWIETMNDSGTLTKESILGGSPMTSESGFILEDVKVCPQTATSPAPATAAAPSPAPSSANTEVPLKVRSVTSTNRPILVVLVSKTTGNLKQRTNQDQALTMLKGKQIVDDDDTIVEVDGSDPSNRERRTQLFEISGLRGQYPQFFLEHNNTDIKYLGDFEWIEYLNETGTLNKETVFGVVPSTSAAEGPPNDDDTNVDGIARTVADVDAGPTSTSTGPTSTSTTAVPPADHEAMASPPAFPSVTVVSGKHLVLLISNFGGSVQQKTNQDRTRTILHAAGLVAEEIDAADPTNKDLRTKLFAISGVRGNYPQVFVKQDDEGSDESYRFVGGFEELEILNDSGSILTALEQVTALATTDADVKECVTDAAPVTTNDIQKEKEIVSIGDAHVDESTKDDQTETVADENENNNDAPSVLGRGVNVGDEGASPGKKNRNPLVEYATRTEVIAGISTVAVGIAAWLAASRR